MKPRRVVAALLGAAALAVCSLPLAPASPANARTATIGTSARPAADYFYSLTSGGMQLVMAPAFLAELSASGATLTAIAPAILALDPASGQTVVTFTARTRNAAVAFQGPGNRTVYFFTKGGLRITGNDTSIDLTNILFAFDNAIGIDMTPNGLDPVDGYAVGSLMRMPAKATRGAVAFTSPRFLVQEPLGEMLRGDVTPGTGMGDGPVPRMTRRAIPLGFAKVALRVKLIPQSEESS